MRYPTYRDSSVELSTAGDARPHTTAPSFRPPVFVVRESTANYEGADAAASAAGGEAADDATDDATHASSSPEGADDFVMDAGALHAAVKALHGLGNEVRVRYIEALRAMHDCRSYLELGCTSFEHYCDREFGIARSTAFEYVRVARDLEGLPRLRTLFARGRLSWDQVRAISRVATESTEFEWIDIAVSSPVRDLQIEVREALRTGRDAPRDKQFGLPNLYVRVQIELTLEEKERVRTAFALVSRATGQDLGTDPWAPASDLAGSEGLPKPPIVRWADAILCGAIPAGPAAGTDGGGPGVGSGDAGAANGRPRQVRRGQTILYRCCPECRSAVVETEDGTISISPKRIDELAPLSEIVEITAAEECAEWCEDECDEESEQAREVGSEQARGKGREEKCEVDLLPAGQVDKPNSRRLTRQVLAREGHRCANPGCGRRRNLQAHHVRFRSKGGRTELGNEIALCETCHALVHQRVLVLSGTPEGGIKWTVRPRSARADLRDTDALRTELRELDAEVEARSRRQSTAVDLTGRAGQAAQAGIAMSTCVDSRSGAAGATQAGSAMSTCVDWWEGAAGVRGSRDMKSSVVDTPPTAFNCMGPESTLVDWSRRVDYLAEALGTLGWSRKDGRTAVEGAIVAMLAERTREPAEAGSPGSAAELDDSEILERALGMRR